MHLDPFGIGSTFFKIQQAWLRHPQQQLEAQRELAASLWMLNLNALTTMVGGGGKNTEKIADGDERFQDPEWQANLGNSLMVQNYLAYTRWLERAVYDSPGADSKDRHAAAFWTRQWFNALAPSNFFLTNPVAIHKAMQTRGASLAKGIEHFMADVKAGDVQMMGNDPAFEVGKNIATTPGSVVFRNELFELIQYHPAGKKVRAMPIVITPPWINKFYIMDLNEKKSMVRHLVNEGFTVFMISWKNPGADMADNTFEKYLLKGMLKAIEAACAITGAPKVHAIGYCIGGTALTALMALLNSKFKPAQVPVAHWTLLASLADFSRPGEIEAFINEHSLATIEQLMEKQGFLDKKQLSSAFRLLRPNSLIWHYVVHKYLYGETPPSLDVLYWNSDSTRLPRAMHLFCLRQFYVDNNLAKKDAIVLDGQKIDLGRITQPLYSVGTTEDHITPWAGTFKTAALVKGPVRYVLSTSGHILGIINPPGPTSKREYWAGEAGGVTNSKTWLAEQKKEAGSWWTDWCSWLHEGCGPLQAPPGIGLPDYPVLCDAPGTYVKET
ncbi:alpha/beta fold hydrolase [Janthinobacterium sp. 17J80-10]|uniref:PHA/PHB synthase family protein n=1 Tax=Janthinobacterium sp. 17J80-10 TaxID=2497863 RepID=UPI001005555A|nr:alpha/beta fold hydrolase [Janthinobacterium sp. 17J80-10]QAU35192.1 alpha/beta fold hydrolase [Janthinobacterium sp. 17J80-10]